MVLGMEKWRRTHDLQRHIFRRGGRLVDVDANYCNRKGALQMNRNGEITILTVCIVAIVTGLIGGVLGNGVKTRSITTEVNIKDSRDIVVTVDGQRVEVSGSGGVAVGGGK